VRNRVAAGSAAVALDEFTLATFLRRRFSMRVLAPMRRHPFDTLGMMLMLSLVGLTLVNALFLQSGKHPAPMRTIASISQAATDTTGSLAMPRPRPAEPIQTATIPAVKPGEPTPHPASGVVADIQKELARRGFYDGTVDGRYGPRMEAAIHHFEQAAGLKLGTNPNEDMLAVVTQSRVKAKADAKPAAARAPQHAEAAPPPARVLAVQRVLSEFGYGQIKTTGVFDQATKAAIEKFEREHKLPVSGKLSDRLLKELASVTGRPIE
jgi:peptidoglycan hydrolase-like protein with peptidoglycan-binding domain